MKFNLEKKVWWGYISEDLQELLCESELLIKKARGWKEKFDDYSFVVFPASKAYEGFLKTLFLDMKLISEEDYYGKRFRIGKALNPALKSRYRERISVYDRLVRQCGGKDLANALWDTWKTCRNVLFHWFPNEKNAVDLDEAVRRVEKVISAFDLAFKECKIE